LTTVLFRRPARRDGPAMPTGEIQLQEPPALPEMQNNGMRQAMMILPMALMSATMALIFVGPSRGALTWVIVGMMALSMGGMVVAQVAFGSADRRQRVVGDRRDYVRYLAQNRRRVRQTVVRQREASDWQHPDPYSLWSLVMTSRRWERRPAHPDFLEVRIGTGEQRLATRIIPLQTKPIEDLEPLAAKSLRRFINAYTTIADQPIALFLPGFAQVRAFGDDPDLVRAFIRALLAQVVSFHAPEDVRLVLCLSAENVAAWEWAKWLPHVQHHTEQDAAGPTRLVADSIEGVERILGEVFLARPRFEPGTTVTRDEPYVVVLRDGGRLGTGTRIATAGYRNATFIDLDDPRPADGKRQLALEVTEKEVRMLQRDRLGGVVKNRMAAGDQLGLTAARSLARLLSPYRLGMATDVVEDSLKTNFDLATLLHAPDLSRLDLDALRAPRPQPERLRVPIGVDSEGSPVELDIKESALGGMGPHGLLIGATGSGKSELLRTLVLGLATTPT
jgi:DNA segregation ATPase FtsK/SpoIIIE, S-DNA-T family